jgi:thymidine phosphorylase
MAKINLSIGDIIAKKRDGNELSEEDIAHWVDQLLADQVTRLWKIMI